MHSDTKIIKPTLPTHGYGIRWDPDPFVASITHNGIIPHPDPANPTERTYLASEISETQFFRFASFYPSATYETFEILFRWVLDCVYLISDGKDDEIYCVSYSAKWGIQIFGKLTKENEVYKRCAAAFAAMAT